MVRSFISLLAKKTAATAIVGTVVVFTGTFALASMSDTPELPIDGAECVELVDACPEEEPETQTDETDETDEGAPLAPIELDDLFGADESSEDSESGDDASEEGDESGEDEKKKTAGEDGYRNHGAAVSEAAHECPAGPDHGKCVSAVAKSDAGKKHEHHDDEDTDEAKADKARWKADKKAAKAEWKADKHADKDHSSDDDDDDDDDEDEDDEDDEG